MRVRITPSTISGVVAAPPSKSYTHRAVILASLAAGDSIIENPLLSDDTIYTINACRYLGAEITLEGNRLKISGTAGQIGAAPGKRRIFAGNSGSTIRLVASLAALGQTAVIFDGDVRLRQRPMGDLLSALESLGVSARSLDSKGYPPVEIQGQLRGGEVTVSGKVSSQHISSLLMVAPYTKEGMEIKVVGKLHSRPYIDITLDIMEAFGVEVENHDYEKFLVKGGQKYKARYYQVEGDYSSAAYLFAAGAVGGKPVTITNLKADSVQGDRHFLTILSEMGCSVKYQKEQVTISRNRELKGITVDMSNYPDIVPTLAVVAAYAHGKTKIKNISRLKFKESDRLNNTNSELAKMGVKTDVSDSAITVYGGEPKGGVIEAHADHRIAMGFTIAALFANGDSIINGVEEVNKSYPRFFVDLRKLGARIEEIL